MNDGDSSERPRTEDDASLLVDVMIVGAGPTGLMAALLLARDGIAVRVVDRNAGPVAQTRAVVVQARTLELWHKLGLAEPALAGGTPVRGARALLDGRDLAPGRMAVDLTAAGTGLTPYPQVLVYGQDQTEQLLLDTLGAEQVGVERDTEVVGLTQHADSVQVLLRDRSGAERTGHARYVIGADGAHSIVRHLIGARFDGAAHPGAFFLADVAVDWDRPYDDALTVALDSTGGMALFVPMRGPTGDPRRFRVFGSLTREPAGPAGGEVTLADVQRRLDERSGLRTRLGDPRWIGTYRLHSRMADVFGNGRVFLAGDAAHIHTPTGGQGMNTGLQDAYNLAWKLSAVLRGLARPALLDTYQAERRPIARAVLDGTDGAFATISTNGPGTRLARPLAARLAPLLLRIPALRRRAFTMISQIAVGYRSSPAVDGVVVRGAAPGDRAPHATLRPTGAPAGSVFDLLTGTDHHLLLLAADHPDPVAARQAFADGLATVSAPVQVHLLDRRERAAHRAYRARRPTAVLVRPDGYVAWRGALDDIDGLLGHLRRWYHPTVAHAGSPESRRV